MADVLQHAERFESQARQAQVALAIVIVNWNTRELLRQCLASVFDTVRSVAFQVIVVDNASHDDSSRMVRKQFPQVQLIENTQNLGFARANNQAIARTKNELILLLNSDTIVLPNAVSRMVTFMNSRPQAGVVGANLLNPDGTAQRCFGPFPSIMTESAAAWGLDTRLPFTAQFEFPTEYPEDHIETGWVLGAACLIRRTAMQQVGVLDPDYFMYAEEVDLAYRMRRAGWRNYVVRDANIIHFGGQSSKLVAAPMKAELFRSKVRYFRKHHGRISAALLDGVFRASMQTKQWSYRLRGRTDVSRLWAETWAYYRETKQWESA